jgi:penicillin-binding protein 1B
MMAISLERHFSKDEILEAYVNEIFLGQDGNRAIHGFGLAAEYYFGKSLAQLDLAQTAMLVGMVKAPSAYNPRHHPEAARARRATVLGLLASRGLVSRSELKQASSRDIVISKRSPNRDRLFGAVVELVKLHLRRDYRDEDLTGSGLKVYTTIDPRIQRAAQGAVTRATTAIENQRSIKPQSLQAALVIVDPHSADVKGLIGGRNGYTAGFNRAINARRSIGSLIKPFVYGAALAHPEQFNVLTALRDEPVTLAMDNGDTWSPKNYSGKFHGRISMRDAFSHSYNLATVNLGLQLGLNDVVQRLRVAGVQGDFGRQPSLLLGAIELSPIEVSQLYQAIANDGFNVPLRVIRVVGDASNVSLSRYPPKVAQVMQVSTAYLVQYLLMRAVADGTGYSAARKLADRMPLGGKTGTSNEGRDSWFAGFGGNYLATVWVGRDDNGPTGLTGASGALGLWIEVMRDIGVRPFEPGTVAGIDWQWVNEFGTAIVPAYCERAARVPLAASHNLPMVEECISEAGSPPAAESGLWDRVRKLFDE